ncbi:MAG: damage-control phosphatase ARMT1 family protein [Chloroflexota bacterium]
MMMPLPPPLRGADPDSFPQRTISTRLPSIARSVLESADWHEEAQAHLQALINEMPEGVLRPLDDPMAPDAAMWENDFAPYVGQTWLEAPWFAVETYFFRRILEATGYYQPGAGYGVDPYRAQKRQELDFVFDSLRLMCAEFDPTYPTEAGEPVENRLASLLRRVIWGNQADRSMWPAGTVSTTDHSQHNEHLLMDQALQASRFLTGRQPARIDFVLDNGGQELAFDLGLADFLLTTRLARSVRLHAKKHPTYVSDATILDILELISFLQGASDAHLLGLAQRLGEHLVSGRLVLKDAFFWTSPLSAWEMPTWLQQELALADLIFSKGDANYRRWLGDRHWPYTTPLENILVYRPAAILALRVLKANMIAGLPEGLSEALDKKDPHWLYNGQWGVIQFVG